MFSKTCSVMLVLAVFATRFIKVMLTLRMHFLGVKSLLLVKSIRTHSLLF
jgi:hypothetical protein